MMNCTWLNLCLLLVALIVNISSIHTLPTIEGIEGHNTTLADASTLEGVHENVFHFSPVNPTVLSVYNMTFGGVVISKGQDYHQPVSKFENVVSFTAGRHQTKETLLEAENVLKADVHKVLSTFELIKEERGS